MSRERRQAEAEVASAAVNMMLAPGRLREGSAASYDILLRFLAEGSASAAEMNARVFLFAPAGGGWGADIMPWEGFSICIYPDGRKTFWDGIVDRTKPDFGTGLDASLEDTLAFAYAYAVQENTPYYVTGVYEQEGDNFYQTKWSCSAKKPEDDVWIRISPAREACMGTDLATFPGMGHD